MTSLPSPHFDSSDGLKYHNRLRYSALARRVACLVQDVAAEVNVDFTTAAKLTMSNLDYDIANSSYAYFASLEKAK